MERLLTYAWPGNIRQLENAIERACVTARDGDDPAREPAAGPRCRARAASGSLKVDLARPLTDSFRADRGLRGTLPPQGAQEMPRPRRPLRQDQRPLAAQHLGQDRPVQDRHRRLQAEVTRRSDDRAFGSCNGSRRAATAFRGIDRLDRHAARLAHASDGTGANPPLLPETQVQHI